MARDDGWYASEAWDADARRVFDEKIRRAGRQHRFGYFRTKAGYLAHASNDPEKKEAVALLERALAELMTDRSREEFARLQKRWAVGSERPSNERWEEEVAEAQACLAELYGEAGRADDATALYRHSIASKPVANRRVHGDPEVEVALARLLRKTAGASARAEIEPLYDAVYAFRFDRPGRTGAGFRSYPALEAEPIREPAATADALAAPYTDPESLAEGIVAGYHAAEDGEPAVPEIFDATRESLAALDAHFERHHPYKVFEYEYLTTTLVAQLGAYLGRVLVRAASAEWRRHAPIMRSRVGKGAVQVNPFLAGYRVVFYEEKLVAAFDELRAELDR